MLYLCIRKLKRTPFYNDKYYLLHAKHCIRKLKRTPFYNDKYYLLHAKHCIRKLKLARWRDSSAG